MTAKVLAFDGPQMTVLLRMDAMPPGITSGDIWLVQPEKDRCTWKQNYDGYYETACSQAYDMEGESPQKWGMNFCPFCGRLITSEAYQEPTDDDE